MSLPHPLGRRRIVVAGALTLGLLATTLTTSTASTFSGAPTSAGPVRATLLALKETAAQAKLNAIVVTARKPPVFKAPGPAIDVAPLKGKTVFALVDDQSIPFNQSVISGLKAATAAAGLRLQLGDGANVTTQDLQLIKNAIAAKDAAIIVSATDPATLASGLSAAKAAGIPTVALFDGDPTLPTPALKTKIGLTGDATYCYTCTGRLVADYALLKKGKVNATVLYDSSSAEGRDLYDGFASEVKKYCFSGCSVKGVTVSAANAAQGNTSGAQVAAQNPAENVIFPTYDYQTAYVLPPIQAAGAAGRIMVVTENADLAQMQDIKNGTAVKLEIGNPVAWDSWGAIDQVARALLHKPNVASENLPLRLFDSVNIGTLNLSADPGTWYGGANYQADYKKLWGLG